jgi:hypothetical protein
MMAFSAREEEKIVTAIERVGRSVEKFADTFASLASTVNRAVTAYEKSVENQTNPQYVINVDIDGNVGDRDVARYVNNALKAPRPQDK